MSTDRYVLGYVPAWDTGVADAELRFDRFTHLAHAFASPTADGGLHGLDVAKAKSLTGPAHAAGVKVLLSLGGGGSGSRHFSAIMADPKKQSLFVDATIKLVTEAGYDGLDCDWEFPENPEDAQRLVDLVALYRKRLPKTLLTMAVTAGGYYGRWLNHKDLLPLFDFLNVMTYDFHGPWGDHAGHNAPLHEVRDDPDGPTNCCAGAMGYWTHVKGFPKEKLLLGLPCYGRSFPVTQWYDPVKKDKKWIREYVSFKDVRKLLAEGWTRVMDDTAGVPYLRKEGEPELISYEDEKSAEAKGAWAKAFGFKGIFFWEVSQDLIGGDHRIVAAARRGFLG